jgi:uridine monophosphate synthetase
MINTLTLPLLERAKLCKNPTARALLEIMQKKETNLAFSADFTHKETILRYADILGPDICVFKTHMDIVEDYDKELVQELKKIAKKHEFLIFEDRKFTDIGTISKLQYEKGMLHISDWAHIINAMVTSGPGIVEGLKEVGLPLERGLLLVAELSSSGSLATGNYTEAAIKIAKEHPEFVIGFICQQKLVDDPSFIHLTPGVKLAKGNDPLGQQYNTPESVIKNGTDVIIVGRGIAEAQNPHVEALLYKEAGWNALIERTANS